MFSIDLWGFFINPTYFGYSSAEQENPVLRILMFQGFFGTQIDLGFFWELIFCHEKHLEIKKSTRETRRTI
jgi:hypothetical protein